MSQSEQPVANLSGLSSECALVALRARWQAAYDLDKLSDETYRLGHQVLKAEAGLPYDDDLSINRDFRIAPQDGFDPGLSRPNHPIVEIAQSKPFVLLRKVHEVGVMAVAFIGIAKS